jgi:hypothetical protein
MWAEVHVLTAFIALAADDRFARMTLMNKRQSLLITKLRVHPVLVLIAIVLSIAGCKRGNSLALPDAPAPNSSAVVGAQTSGIIYLTDQTFRAIFTAWKRQEPYNKQSFISRSLRTAMPL